MSHTEYHTGKIIRIETDDINQYLKEKINKSLDEIDSYDLYEDHGFIVRNGSLYTIDDNEVDPYNITSQKLAKGFVQYSAGFHNGGTCLWEILEEIIDKHFGEK